MRVQGFLLLDMSAAAVTHVTRFNLIKDNSVIFHKKAGKASAEILISVEDVAHGRRLD